MNDDVTTYLAQGQPWQVEAGATLRDILIAAAPDLVERLQYKKPHYLRNGHYAAVLTLPKGKVALMLFNAAGIPEEPGFIRALGDGSRKQIEFTEGDTIDRERIAALVKETTAGLV